MMTPWLLGLADGSAAAGHPRGSALVFGFLVAAYLLPLLRMGYVGLALMLAGVVPRRRRAASDAETVPRRRHYLRAILIAGGLLVTVIDVQLNLSLAFTGAGLADQQIARPAPSPLNPTMEPEQLRKAPYFVFKVATDAAVAAKGKPMEGYWRGVRAPLGQVLHQEDAAAALLKLEEVLAAYSQDLPSGAASAPERKQFEEVARATYLVLANRRAEELFRGPASGATAQASATQPASQPAASPH
jgi:hypothetical protein